MKHTDCFSHRSPVTQVMVYYILLQAASVLQSSNLCLKVVYYLFIRDDLDGRDRSRDLQVSCSPTFLERVR